LAPEYGGAAISEASLCQSLNKIAPVKVACRRDRWNRKFVREFGIQNVLEFQPIDFYYAWKKPDHPIRGWFENIDVVHLNGHWRWEYYFISRICNELTIPYLVHPRGMMLVAGRKHQLKQLFNWAIGREIAKDAYKIVALSEFETKQLSSYSLPPTGVEIIPNGVCTREESRPVHSARGTSDHFLYFGRIEHRKNLLFLLEAYDQYLKMGGTRKLRLKGPVEHGYEDLVNQKIESLKLGHHVSLLAPSYGEEKWKHLSQATAVLYPCLDEPFGRVPFETLLAGGLPIIPKDSGGAEYLGPVLPQVIYPTHNQQALADQLLWAENLDATERQRILELGRQWVQENLDWEKITEKVCKVYESSLSSKISRKRPKSSGYRLFGFLGMDRIENR